jgi:hypothetical protein
VIDFIQKARKLTSDILIDLNQIHKDFLSSWTEFNKPIISLGFFFLIFSVFIGIFATISLEAPVEMTATMLIVQIVMNLLIIFIIPLKGSVLLVSFYLVMTIISN